MFASSSPKILAGAAAIALLAGCSPRPDRPTVPVATAPPAEVVYVGRQACAGCHAAEDRLWQGSHHDRAMQEATEGTVLGDFEGASLTHFGVTSRFFRRDGKFFVRTDGPDGTLHDYPIAYTFGVFPLQQYLVRMEGGRLQALPLCWDARPAGEGGQRWFHLYPGEAVPAGDDLHWTGSNQTWNYMCAECHSTGLRKGWPPARGGGAPLPLGVEGGGRAGEGSGEGTYETTWAEIDVSCEACHGPGSRHVAWAGSQDARSADPRKGLAAVLRDPGRGTWVVDPETGNGKRLAPPLPQVATAEVETCARCHASRAVIQEPSAAGMPLLDSHRPALLDPGFYHADGQIEGEVYEYGPFVQSRMFHKGVTCSDCHEPHAATLRRTGNDLCTHCHAPAKFDAPAHSHHPAGARGSACVDCHMPAKTYMVVDPRRDHSLRVPRPDLSAKLGTPNACNGCHTERSPQWAAAAVARWYGPERRQEPHWGEAILAGRENRPGAGEALARVAGDAEVPAIARATALGLLARNPAADPQAALGKSLADTDPLVRLGALAAAESVEPGERWRLASPLLKDSVRGIRIEAARVLASLLPGVPTAEDPDLAAALAEYRAAQETNGDRPEAHLNLGWLGIRRGRPDEAAEAFRTALRLDPAFVPAYVNLADLHRLQGREAEGERLLRQALDIDPANAAAHHALGLLLVRTRRLPEALDELGEAARLDPREPRYANVWALALQEVAGR